MIDNEWYGNSTDEMFEKSSGYVGQGLKTLFKHFIASFCVFILVVTLLLLVYFSVCVVAFDQEKNAQEYFKTTDTRSVAVRFVPRGNNTANEREFESLIGNRSFVKYYRMNSGHYPDRGIWDYSNTIWRTLNYRAEFANVIKASDIDMEAMGYSMVIGRMPESSSEVTITKYLYDLYKIYGFNDNGQLLEINNPEDVIGKVAFDRTIVGILDTKLTTEVLDLRKMSTFEQNKHISDLGCEVGRYIHNSIIVKDISIMSVEFYGWEVLLNHDETDMVFYDMYKEYYMENGHYDAANKDSYIWWYYDISEIMSAALPIMLGILVLGIIFSLILLAGSFRDKKKLISILSKKDYDIGDYMELFVPEIVVLLLSIIIFALIAGFVGVSHLEKYSFFAKKFFEDNMLLAFGADAVVMVIISIQAFIGVRKKIKKEFNVKPNKDDRDFNLIIDGKVEDKIQDRYF